jgi:outer membrane protein TolC
MRAVRRLAVPLILSLTLGACAAVGGGQPPSLAQLDIADQYSTPSANGVGPLDPAGLERCWLWLDDPLLGELVEHGDIAAETKARIARGYIGLRARQARIANARTYLADQLDNLDVARFREEAKLVTVRDAVQADAERARIAARIPGLDAENVADAARIAVLGGQAPAAVRDRLALAAPIPTEPAQIGVGLPSDLLIRRDDLQKAQTRYQASLLAGPAKVRSAYRTAVLAALEDVERAQAAFDGAVARARALAVAADKAEALARLARQQYREGQADYAAVSSAEAELLAARDALAETRGARASASIDLCVALGGGRPPAAKAGG